MITDGETAAGHEGSGNETVSGQIASSSTGKAGKMEKKNRITGLMLGITLGFAVWGSVSVTPGPWAPETETAAESESPDRRKASAQTGQMTDQSETSGAVRTTSDSIERTTAQTREQPADTLSLHALSAVLTDADSGRILYEKDADTPRPMASTTKIMTCILALENGSSKDICRMSDTARAQPKVHLGAVKGTEFYLQDLLYSLMLESHNDSAVMIAECIGGSVEGFAEMMNQKARDIGCHDTCFVTPNGLDAAVTDAGGMEHVHSTTAADLAAVLRYCITQSPKRDEFLAITRTADYAFTDVSGKYSFSCTNHNVFLSMMPGALTGKTGFTGGAGYSYVAALQDGERIFILSLLGCGWPPHKTWKWEDARKLFQYGLDHYDYQEIAVEAKLPALPVREGIRGEKIPLTLGASKEELQLRLLLCGEDHLEQQLQLEQELEAPVETGSLAGYLIYRLNGKELRRFPVYTAASMERWTFAYCIQYVLKIVLL